MRVAARAPGKLVILGEYAVLEGAPALVMAVGRYARARMEPSADGRCRVEASFGTRLSAETAPGEPTGIALVDAVSAGSAARPPAWHAVIDSGDFFAEGIKLGLGSSAAALCAFAGAWERYCRAHGAAVEPLSVERLIETHRALQGGSGSGIDVAAAYTGGVIRYALDAARRPLIGSVRLPNSVGFAGIFAGSAASTPDLVSRFRAWEAADKPAASRLKRMLGGIAAAGCQAASAGDASAFLAAVSDYGKGLESLGRAMQADIVTAEHRRIGRAARALGVVYKVSGAGGGDVGLALSQEPDDLTEFTARVARMGFAVVDLTTDQQGLFVEELSE